VRTLALAVSLSDVWDPARIFDVPLGWRRATDADWRANAAEAKAHNGGHCVYFRREGWNGIDGCEWDGVDRVAFVTTDTREESGFWLNAVCSWTSAGLEYPIRTAAKPTAAITFAGLVCVRE
jgi:hypothetical protein